MALGLRHRRGFAVEDWDDFSVDRVRWIIRLRWVALSTILIAALTSIAGFFPGVNWRVLLATVGGAGIYNIVLWLRHRSRPTQGTNEAIRQAIVDMGLLTIVLWA